MEQKILDRITELTNEINSLLEKREVLIKELTDIDLSIQIMSNSIYELKKIINQGQQD